MKLLDLHLAAFGGFSDELIDLSGGAEGLHLVYGENEAGKSTALTAVEYLLYGFPHRTSLDFLHKASDLRIGGRIRGSSGEALEFVRRKGRKDTLLSPGGDPLGDDVLAPYLQGVDRKTFRRMFGLDHEGLVQGGQDILKGQGEVGESLFAAGLGTASLREVQRGLENEAGELFLARGQVQWINKAASDLNGARKRVREYQLREQDWFDLKKQLDDAELGHANIQETLSEKRHEKARLERTGRLVPVVGALKKVEADLDAMGEVIMLPAGFSEDRADTEKALKEAVRGVARSTKEIARLEKELAELSPPELLLSAGVDIGQLREDLGEYRKNGRDLPKREAEQIEINGEATGILRELKPGLGLDQASSLRLTSQQKRQIRKLAKQRQSLDSQLNSLHDAVRSAKSELKNIEEDLNELPEPRDPAELKQTAKRAARLGNIEAQCAEHTEKAAAGRRSAGQRLARLQQWDGTLGQLRSAKFPCPETVERFRVDLDERTTAVVRTTDALAEARTDRENAMAGLRHAEVAGTVPQAEDLVASRERRERGWGLVRRSWKGDEVRESELQDYDPDRELADAYEKSVEKADEVSDRLRLEADRVAQVAGLHADVAKFTEETEALVAQLAIEQEALEGIRAEWVDLWVDCGIQPATPAEMKAWIDRVASIVADAEAADVDVFSAQQLSARIREARDTVGTALEALGERDPADDEDLGILLDRAEQVVETATEINDKRREFEKSRKRLTATLNEQKETTRTTRHALDQWTTDWVRALTDAGLDEDLQPDETEDVLERLDRLFQRLDDSSKLDRRIDGMRADIDAFEARLDELTNTLAPDLADMPEGLAPERAVRWLAERLEQAGKEAERRAGLADALEKERANLRGCREAEESSRADLAALCERAGCDDPDDLPGIENQSDQHSRLSKEKEELLTRVAETSGGEPPETAIKEVEGTDPDRLPAEIDKVETQIDELERERGITAENKGALRVKLDALEKERPASEAAEEVESAMARLREGVLRYLPVRLAQELLRREIDEYRKRHQGPLVTRASEIFEALSVGSFDRLTTDFLEDDTLVLAGVRPNGERVRVDGMSDGTRDQLYLALRLASLEMYLATREAVPLVVDDIMINFDDERAAAGLKVLATLSDRTQVILFTHHKRIVELGEATIPNERLFVTHLG